ncbi:MAG: Na+/H+ antiporter subunit E, partial [Bacteroidota bacterium]|nr:Na+/H+ antiporter subunit E [Bacteroidota bacterium]
SSRKYFKVLPLVLEFFFFLLWEIIISNFRLAITILSPRLNLKHAVIAVPLDIQSEIGVVLLANMISLTPGTLSLDISSNKHMLYVHVYDLDNPETFVKEIKKNYERRIMEIIE